MASKEQKEGLARVLDTFAASSVIGLAIDFSGNEMTLIQRDFIILCVLFPVLFACSWLLRRPS